MNKIFLAVVVAVPLVFCACGGSNDKGAADVNNTLKEPSHVNMSTEPDGAAPASSASPK
jgi:hypothetical protein